MKRFLPLLLLVSLPAVAGEPAALEAERTPGVEDNIRAMDTDRDGMVTAHEVRAFIEARRGKDFEQRLLDDFELLAGGRSCASPFSRSTF